jgi:hypothetical protein
MKANHIWTFSGLGLIAAILFGTSVFGVMPTLVSIQAKDSQRQTILRENEVRTAFLEKLKDTAADKQALFVAVSKQRDLFPPQLNAVELMNELDQISQTSGAEIANLSILPAQPFAAPSNATNSVAYAKALTLLSGSTLAVSEVSLTLRGTASHIQSFISKTHNDVRYVLIYGAVFGSGTGSAASDIVSADLSAQIFTLH